MLQGSVQLCLGSEGGVSLQGRDMSVVEHGIMDWSYKAMGIYHHPCVTIQGKDIVTLTRIRFELVRKYNIE
jgi:hypothetical protein